MGGDLSLDLQGTCLHHWNGSFLLYLEKAFTQHNGGLKFTTTTLRKALVTWVIETGKDEEVRQAVPCLML